MIWFTADEHFYHKNVIDIMNRPYASMEQMIQEMIEEHNKVVGKNDTVYHLGENKMTKLRKKRLLILAKYHRNSKRYYSQYLDLIYEGLVIWSLGMPFLTDKGNEYLND